MFKCLLYKSTEKIHTKWSKIEVMGKIVVIITNGWTSLYQYKSTYSRYLYFRLLFTIRRVPAQKRIIKADLTRVIIGT